MADSQGYVLELASKKKLIPCHDFLFFEIPNGMGPFSTILCVTYMIMPIGFTIYEIGRNMWGMQRGWPTDEYPSQEWSKEDRRMIGRLMRALKIIAFFLFIQVFCFLENILFRGVHDASGLINLSTDIPRCEGKELTFPSFTATYTIALMAVLKVDQDIALSIRYLVWEKYYTQEMVERLGYVQIGMDRFFFRSLVIMTCLFPPAVAVLALGNAGFADALVGALQGVLLGIVFHSFWMKYFTAESGGHLLKLETKLFIPMLHGFRSFLDKLEAVCTCIPRTGRQLDKEEPLLTREESQTIAVESAMVSLKDVHPVKIIPGMEFMHIRNDAIINECIESFGGFQEAKDGLAKKSHVMQKELEEKVRELEEVKLKEFEAKAKEFEAEKDAMSAQFEAEKKQHKEELEGIKTNLMQEIADIRTNHDNRLAEERDKQEQLLEEEKKSMLAKLEEVQTTHNNKLAEEREAQEKLLEDEKQAMKEQKEKEFKLLEDEKQAMKEQKEKEFQEEKKAMNDAFEEEKRQHREELQRQGEFSRNLVESSETLTEMTKAIEDGDWVTMNTKYTELKQKQDVMTQGGENKELNKMLASITPIFDGKLAEVEVKRVEWKRSLKFVMEALAKAEGVKADPETDKELVPPVAQELFRAVSDMIKNGLVLKQADVAIQAGLVEEVDEPPTGPEGRKSLMARVEYILSSRWQACVAKYRTDKTHGATVKELQDKIILKAIEATRSQLGSFDFTDLETCCEAVDVTNKTFLEKAGDMINDKGKTISQLPSTLGQLFTMLYFLEHLEKENQEKCRRQFAEKLKELKGGGEGAKKITAWVQEISKLYADDSALLQAEDLKNVIDKEAQDVIKSMCDPMRAKQCEPLGVLYEIFCSLARAWQRKFDVLAVPHHTQVFALLVFRKFLEAGDPNVQTLIGQVGTGEGKSMLIAELAALCARKGKKVHVVGTDSKLVMRDFESFRELFNDLKLKAFVCSDSREGEDEKDIIKGITDEADIVYCEPKHVESFYAGKARRGELGVAVYKDRVLILDEVDALVVDQEPTQQFVYDISWREISAGEKTTISEYAVQLIRYLIKEGVDKYEEEIRPDLKPPPQVEGQQPSEKRHIFDEARGLLKGVIEWDKNPNEDFRLYEGSWKLENGVNLKGKYVHVIGKIPRCDANSNFLEVLRLFEASRQGTEYPMRWFQKLFVMSKPRVFRQYENIMGFSGTIGNEKEQKFFRDSYGAEFFLVPPFLSTCIDKEDPSKEMFHTANWAGRESVGVMYDGIIEGPKQGPLVVVNDSTKQYQCVKGLAMKARQHVPVLIIAKDTDQCKSFVKQLRREIGAFADDVVRSLSQDDYDRNASLYKESLKKSTKATGAKGQTLYRITVTDPSGARGTDYQMRDEEPDRLGGLMLIVLHIPLSERDWVQYKGRTARQKWRGQYCAVLQASDYKELEAFAPEKGYEVKNALPEDVYKATDAGASWIAPSTKEAHEVVKQIMAFGGEEAEANLRKTRAVYNSGFIANEICEEVWMIWKDSQENEAGFVNVDIKLRGAGRDAFLTICNKYRYLSATAIQEQVGRIKDDKRTAIKYNVKTTKAPNPNYTPEEPPKDVKKKKAILFVMDVSFSMSQGDPSKLDTCKVAMKELLTSKGFLGKDDFVGVVAFGKGHKYLLELKKADNVDGGSTHLAKVSDIADGTAFEDAMGKMGSKEDSLGLSTWMFKTMTETIVPFMDREFELADDEDEEDLQRCMVLLCDGGDSAFGVGDYEKAKKTMKRAGDKLTLIVITVGNDRSLIEAKPKLLEFVQQGSKSSNLFHADDDPKAIAAAFKQVQQALTFSDVGIVEAN